MSRAAHDAAERLGLDYAAKGDGELRARFADLPEVPKRAALRHVITGAFNGRPLLVFQSAYMIFTGQTTMQESFTVYVNDAPMWPRTQVVSRGLFGRLGYRLGHRPGLQLEDPRFNGHFKVRSDEEDFAITLLGPQMQAFMLDKTSVRWRIGAGRVCLVYAGTLKPKKLDASLRRLDSFWSLVTPELLAW